LVKQNYRSQLNFLALFFADVFMGKKRRIPNWYLRLKLFSTFATIISITAMGILVATHQDKLIAPNDPLRKKNIPSDHEILSGNIKQEI